MRAPNAFVERDPVSPAESMDAGHVEDLARRPVGLLGVEDNLRPGRDGPTDELRKLADRRILAGPHVEVFLAVVVLHEEDTGLREVVDVEELAARRTGAPHH